MVRSLRFLRLLEPAFRLSTNSDGSSVLNNPIQKPQYDWVSNQASLESPGRSGNLTQPGLSQIEWVEENTGQGKLLEERHNHDGICQSGAYGNPII
jgi:hypothetical protein